VEGAPVVPLCPFIASWIERHLDYDDLVYHDALRRLDTR
jgi:predicted GNAT family acetyltransferase